VDVRFSVPVQTYPRAHPASFTLGTSSLSQQESGWGMVLTTRALLVLRFCVGRGIAVPLFFALIMSHRVTFIYVIYYSVAQTYYCASVFSL